MKKNSPRRKKSLSKRNSDDIAPPLFKRFTELKSRRDQRLLAKYGPVAFDNPTFEFVRAVGEPRNRERKPSDGVVENTKNELFNNLLACLASGDADIFRQLAAAIESISKAASGEFYHRIAYELLHADIPPKALEQKLGKIWGADLVTREDILRQAGVPIGQEEDEGAGAFRNLDRLKAALGIDIGVKKRGPKAKKDRRL